jgi:hypothetical protein
MTLQIFKDITNYLKSSQRCNKIILKKCYWWFLKPNKNAKQNALKTITNDIENLTN